MMLAFACAGAPEPARTPPKPRTLAERLPKRSELPCFPCHSQIVFEKGPRFAHASVGHRDAGHCHRCHLGMGHHGRDVDRTACLSCHPDGAKDAESRERSDRRRR
jgi:hypothetical protein